MDAFRSHRLRFKKIKFGRGLVWRGGVRLGQARYGRDWSDWARSAKASLGKVCWGVAWCGWLKVVLG